MYKRVIAIALTIFLLWAPAAYIPNPYTELYLNALKGGGYLLMFMLACYGMQHAKGHKEQLKAGTYLMFSATTFLLLGMPYQEQVTKALGLVQ